MISREELDKCTIEELLNKLPASSIIYKSRVFFINEEEERIVYEIGHLIFSHKILALDGSLKDALVGFISKYHML